MNIEVNLLPFKNSVKVKKEGAQTLVFDPIRKKYLVLAPEELVRQLFIQYLVVEKNFPKTKFGVEKGLQVIDLAKRYDLLIYDKNHAPILLVECKAPKVIINQKTFEQIARYNLALRVKYLVVTNGLTTFCCKVDYETQQFSFLDKIPSWDQMHQEPDK